MRTSSVHPDKKPKTLSRGLKIKDTEHKDTGAFSRHQGLGLGIISRQSCQRVDATGTLQCVIISAVCAV